jgi:regulator of protease activity HflC (stomatin/prohibitin superfamily)
MACFAQVSTGNVGMVTSFGKFVRKASPGCIILNPFFCEFISDEVSMRLQQLDVSCETKTKDNVFVVCMVSVQYQVVPGNEALAVYKLTDPQRQIKAYIFDVVRASVPKINLDDVFAAKEEIALSVKSQLAKAMDSFGFQIMNALITDITPDTKVRNAMNEINAAQRLREATKDKAEAEKLLVVKAAEAESESKYLAGVGIARQRQAIISGLKESVVAFSSEVPGTTASEIMDMMMLTQYNDMLKDIGSSNKCSTVFVPQNSASAGDLAGDMRSGVLQAGLVQSAMHR